MKTFKYMVHEDDYRNVIRHTLGDIYGYEESKPLRSVVESSPRYAELLAIASHDNEEWTAMLKAALAKVVKNPKTRAAF